MVTVIIAAVIVTTSLSLGMVIMAALVVLAIGSVITLIYSTRKKQSADNTQMPFAKSGKPKRNKNNNRHKYRNNSTK
jgi:hypothetical protein